MGEAPKSDFEKAASEPANENIFVEYLDFVRHNKKWWLIPMLLIMITFGILILLSNTAAAPFIYTLF